MKTTTASQDLQTRIEALKTKTLEHLVKVKGGTFTMGDFGPIHNADKLPYTSERDDDVLREVTLDDFSIGAYKITYHDFDTYTDAVGKPRIAQEELDHDDRTPPNMPAGVNWFDAQAYCEWIGKQVGRAMSLPTEAQWEYAARSGGKMALYATDNGKVEDGRNVGSLEQYDEFSAKHGTRSWFTSIGLYPPNPLGLYDMIDHGFEWVTDWYAPEYDKADGKNPRGPVKGNRKGAKSEFRPRWRRIVDHLDDLQALSRGPVASANNRQRRAAGSSQPEWRKRLALRSRLAILVLPSACLHSPIPGRPCHSKVAAEFNPVDGHRPLASVLMRWP